MRIVLLNSFFLKSVLITTAVILVGVLIISPAFLENKEKSKIILSFDLNPSDNLENWCEDLSQITHKDVRFVVFMHGELAKNHPTCLVGFGEKVDIGSKTYDNLELPTLDDYLEQLDQVKRGKKAIDEIGNFDSKIFRAPGMVTDDNIFSLLSKNGIDFDLSYSDHYNKFHNGQFLRFELISIDWRDIETITFSELDKETPILISIDNSVSVNEITKIIDKLKKKNVKFVNPSDLMEKDLTAEV